MIWFAFIGLLIFVVAEDGMSSDDGDDMCIPTGTGCIFQDMTGQSPEGYEYDCANGDYRVRSYENAECSGEPAVEMTMPAANMSGVACGSCTSYIKFAGSVYGTDDCSGTAAGTATQAIGRGDSGLFDVCLDGTIVQCNGGSTIVAKNYAKDDCTGAVKDSFTWKKNACAQFFSNSTFMKFTAVECNSSITSTRPSQAPTPEPITTESTTYSWQSPNMSSR
eukprot:58197_1